MKIIKLSFCLFAFLTNAVLWSHEEKGLNVSKKRLPGIRLSTTNSIILQQLIRSQVNRNTKAEEIRITMVCKKKFRVRGRDSKKSYICLPEILEDLSKK